MNEPMGTTPAPAGGQDNRQRNRIIAVVVGLIVLCGCCLALAAGVWLWNNGDSLLEQLQSSSHWLPYLLAL